MTIIKASCHRCGEVTVTPDEFTVVTGPAPLPGVAGRFEFQCPLCDGLVCRPLDERYLPLLLEAGVLVKEPHPEPHRPGAVLCDADVAAFRAALASTDYLAGVA